MDSVKTILHPTDFSEHSYEALAIAASLARDRHARLVVLHAVPVAAPVTGAGGPELEHAERRQTDLQTYQQEMEQKLRRLQVPLLPVPLKRIVEHGDPASVVLKKAEELSCNLIVLGTHGRTREGNRMMGSVAEEVSRKAPCPVLVVRLPANARK
jgi:universal stress protein A